jgi:hypothetical protein
LRQLIPVCFDEGADSHCVSDVLHSIVDTLHAVHFQSSFQALVHGVQVGRLQAMSILADVEGQFLPIAAEHKCTIASINHILNITKIILINSDGLFLGFISKHVHLDGQSLSQMADIRFCLG